MDAKDFNKLYNTDCSKKIEKKNDLSYLSWAWAWAEFANVFPEATYEVVKFDGLPYVADPVLGIMVYTKVTAGGVTREMWLPVMDPANKPMKLEPYTYSAKVYNSQTRRSEWVDKTVKGADMFDINKTIMRCLTKNLAMFGIGLSIYAGEDIPQPLSTDEEEGIARDAEQKTGKGQKKQRTVETKQEPQPEKPHLTIQMFQEGSLQELVDWVKGKISPDGEINPAYKEKMASKYDWEPGALDMVWNQALNS